MSKERRRFPCLVGSRYTQEERAALELAAKVERSTLNDYVRAAVLPAVRDTLARTLDRRTPPGGSS